jgi:hypothetical protein
MVGMKGRSAQAEVSKVPPLLRAIRATVSTVDARGRAYRWAVVAMAFAVCAPLLWALVSLSWRPLPFAALVVPVVGSFLVVDNQLVVRWQRRILTAWASGDFPLSAFRQTLQAIRHLPASTVAGMVERLPTSDAPDYCDRLPEAARGSVVGLCLARTERQTQRTLLATAGSALLVSSIAVAVLLESISFLAGAVAGLLLIGSSRRVGASS